MDKIKNFLSAHSYFYLMLLFIPIQIWFQILEHNLVPQYITQTALDSRIPFIKEFVVPYLIWFIFVPYGVLFVGFYSRKDFLKLFTFLCGGMTAANILFMIFPNVQHLRPAIHSGDPFSLLVNMIYTLDTPTNVCPSVHVINSIAVNAALQHSETFSKKRFGKAISGALTILICLSTVFIKQHSALDVAAGFAVSALFYIPLYGPFAQKLEKFAESKSVFQKHRAGGSERNPRRERCEK